VTRLTGIGPGQAATGNPSPPVVVSPNGAREAAAAEKKPDVPKPPQRPVHVRANPDAVKAAAEQIEKWMKSSGRALEFRVDSTSGHTVVSVRNPQTGELIRQIPSEETLRLASLLGASSNTLIDVEV
jgi:flagellar protein FlaG